MSSLFSSSTALRAGDGRLNLAVDLCDLVDGTAELLGVDDKGGDDTDGNQTVDGEIAAEGCDDDEADVADAVHDRPHDAAEHVGADARFRQRVGSLTKLLGGDILVVVGYDGSIAGDHLLHGAVELAQELLALSGKLPDLSGQDFVARSVSTTVPQLSSANCQQ